MRKLRSTQRRGFAEVMQWVSSQSHWGDRVTQPSPVSCPSLQGGLVALKASCSLVVLCADQGVGGVHLSIHPINFLLLISLPLPSCLSRSHCGSGPSDESQDEGKGQLEAPATPVLHPAPSLSWSQPCTVLRDSGSGPEADTERGSWSRQRAVWKLNSGL